jgi:uncharacterized membrane protein
VGRGVYVCYACRSRPARARSIGGTRYFLCDECYELHKRANRQMMEYLNQRRSSFRRGTCSGFEEVSRKRDPFF